MAYPNSDLFSQGWNVRPEALTRMEVDVSNKAMLATGNVYTITSTAATIVQDFIGSRPCWNITNSGSTATDVLEGQVVGDLIRPVAGKELLYKGSLRMTTTTQEFAFGFAAGDTSIIASDPTDFLMFEKLTGATKFSIRARKASGTAQVFETDTTVAVDTWYDFAVRLVLDANTAGKGLVQVAFGASVGPGDQIPVVFNQTFSSQIPDPVDLRPFFAWRAGSAANVSGYIGTHGWALAA